MATDYKLLYEQSERGYQTLAEQLLARDKADLKAREEAERAKTTPPDRLKPAQSLYEAMKEDAEWVEACRVSAWLATSIYRTGANFDGSWPPGVDKEEFCRKELGLNADGTAMLDGPTEEAEPELRDDTSLHKLLRQRHRL
jgi:hypothetical protein